MTNLKSKILFISRPIAPPWDEASKNFAYNLAREVAKNNPDLEIHLMTRGILPSLPKNIIQHPIYTSSQNDFNLSQKLKMLRFLIWQAKNFNVAHFLFTPTKINGLILKFIFKFFARQTRIIQTIATIREDLFSDKEIKSMMFGDKIVTYSEYAKKKLEKLGLRNVQKVYPGIDLEDYKPKDNNKIAEIPDKRFSNSSSAKRKSAFRNDRYSFSSFVINFTGEYIRLGAMDNVIDAFIDVSSQIPEARLSLAVRVKNKKDAQKKQQVIAKLKKNNLLKKISFHDNGNYKMSDIYNLCDISLFPVQNMKGKFDVPLAVIEAMACEKPVILSDIPILKEFANERNSLTVKAGDVKELSKAILNLYKNKQQRLTLGKQAMSIGRQAREYVLQNFNIQKAGKKYAEIYKSL